MKGERYYIASGKINKEEEVKEKSEQARKETQRIYEGRERERDHWKEMRERQSRRNEMETEGGEIRNRKK